MRTTENYNFKKPDSMAVAFSENMDAIDAELKRLDGKGGAGGEGIDYSLDEQWTGRHWVDGRKVYQKTVNFGAMPNSSSREVLHNITSFDYLISVSGTSQDAIGQRLPIPNAHGSGADVSLTGSNKGVAIHTWANYSTYTKTYVTLEYTCTDR